MRDELQSVLASARELPAPELPRLLGELREIECVAMARLSAPAIARPDESLLTVKQAAKRLRMSANYLYRHSDSLPFVRRMGRNLRFSSTGIQDYISRRGRK